MHCNPPGLLDKRCKPLSHINILHIFASVFGDEEFPGGEVIAEEGIKDDLGLNGVGGKAPKGLGRGKDKVGYGKCGEETVIYQVATQYYGKKIGESTFDPVFVLAAILEWAGIAENGRGYIKLF